MLCSANLQDRAVFAMCSLKVSWSSKITPRFLTEVDGVIVEEPSWMVKSCCRDTQPQPYHPAAQDRLPTEVKQG